MDDRFEAKKLLELCGATRTVQTKDGDTYSVADYPTQLAALKYLGKLKGRENHAPRGSSDLLGTIWVRKG